ncbi:hypothetical protein GCM10010515_75480 [Streptomyces fructofermentans]|uniref:Uncharacterized protein n=1 Tax=Streptomyces fructofermentans TaxID=152141 RepID=A0A918NVX9_9ACTN|nr:hypothetical protein GCM10010515_75480 [Streptomyces fructofermentans]
MPSRVAVPDVRSGPLDQVLADACRAHIAGLERGERVRWSLDVPRGAGDRVRRHDGRVLW